jgi:hypothetical protein
MNMLIKYSMMFALYYNFCVRGKTFQTDCKGNREKVGRNDCQHVREHEVHKRAHCAHSDQDALHAGLKLEPLAFRDG